MFATVRNTGARLRVGQKFTLGGVEYVVELVNECRARCRPVGRTRHVEIDPRFSKDGKRVQFEAKLECINISPNTEL